jgi:hypothetical protein
MAGIVDLNYTHLGKQTLKKVRNSTAVIPSSTTALSESVASPMDCASEHRLYFWANCSDPMIKWYRGTLNKRSSTYRVEACGRIAELHILTQKQTLSQ